MSIGLLLGACALVCWPTVRRPAALETSLPRPTDAPRRGEQRVAGVLSAAVLVLVTAWQPTVAGTGVAIAAASGTFLLLRRRRGRLLPHPTDPSLPLVLTVAALLLRAGTPPATALAAAARSCHSTSCAVCELVERRLSMGESPLRAWAGLNGVTELAAVGRAAVRTSHSGAALADAWSSAGERLRADRRLAAEVRARKVGVRVLAPLGLCFLPSFICLGVVPMVIGLAGDIL